MLCGGLYCSAVPVTCVSISGRYAGAAENVMKLIEHNILPALLYFRLRIFTVYKIISYYACRLTVKQRRFGAAVILLNGCIITVRSQIPCLQLIADRNFRLYISEKSAYRAIRNIIILTFCG